MARKPANVCAQCGDPLPAGLDFCPECLPDAPVTEAVPVVLAVVLLCSAFLLVGSSVVNVAVVPVRAAQASAVHAPAVPRPAAASKAKPPSDMKLAAYNAARQFLAQRAPGIKSVYPYNPAMISGAGNSYQIHIAGDEMLRDGSMGRCFVTLDVEYRNGNWILKKMER